MALNAIESFINDLKIGDSYQDSHVGLVTFSENAIVQFKLSDYTDKTSLLNAIKNTQYADGSGTNIPSGMEMALNKVFQKSGDRANVPNVMILITDGNDQYDVSVLQSQAKQLNVDIFALGVGRGYNRTKLEAATGYTNRVFDVEDYTRVQEVLKTVCNVIAQPITPEPTVPPCLSYIENEKNLTLQMSDIQQKSANDEAKIRQLEQDLKNAGTKSNEDKLKLQELTQKLNISTLKHKEDDEKLKKLQKDFDDSKTELINTKAKVQEDKAKMENLQKELDEAKRKIHESQGRIQELEEGLNLSDKKVKEGEERIKKQEDEIEVLKGSILTMTLNHANEISRRNKMDEEKEKQWTRKLQEERTQCNKKVTKLENEIGKQHRKINSLQSKIQRLVIMQKYQDCFNFLKGYENHHDEEDQDVEFFDDSQTSVKFQNLLLDSTEENDESQEQDYGDASELLPVRHDTTIDAYQILNALCEETPTLENLLNGKEVDVLQLGKLVHDLSNEEYRAQMKLAINNYASPSHRPYKIDQNTLNKQEASLEKLKKILYRDDYKKIEQKWHTLKGDGIKFLETMNDGMAYREREKRNRRKTQRLLPTQFLRIRDRSRTNIDVWAIR
uniref:VWFA domain-containing protein n=1 Tax=Acrobeloides nanus TaxID=290746 RepID=A0A914ELJ8_9BILA